MAIKKLNMIMVLMWGLIRSIIPAAKKKGINLDLIFITDHKIIPTLNIEIASFPIADDQKLIDGIKTKQLASIL